MELTTIEPQEIIIDAAGIQLSIKDGLAELALKKEKIEYFKKKSQSISIKDMDDKEGYEATKEFIREMQKERTATEEARIAVVRTFNTPKDQVSALYKIFTTEISKCEADHVKEKKEYEDHKKFLKEKEEREREQAINDKILLLENEGGLVFNPLNNFWMNDNGIAVSKEGLMLMDEEKFETLLAITIGHFEDAKKAKEEENQKKLILLQREKEERETFEKEKAELAAEKLKMKRAKVQAIAEKLEPLGFTYKYNGNIEDDHFVNGEATLYVRDAFSDESLIAGVISLANEYKKSEEKKLNEQNLAAEKAEGLRKEKQAKKKVDSKADLAKIDSEISGIVAALAGIQSKKFKVIEEYSTPLVSAIVKALKEFESSVSHLRTN